MKDSLSLLILLLASAISSCQQPSKTISEKAIKVGGNCEGCEAIYESPVPFEQLNEVDTLPDFTETGPRIEISGIVYKADGKTPAPGVVLYVYHTDQKGLYPKRDGAKGWASRHGYIRGWVKTDQNGFYKFYTLVPASYPGGTNPKHIHPVIKEPGYSEYWIDEFVFDDDPVLPQEERTRPNPVGGAGVLKTVPIAIGMKDGMLRATRNIILGLNVRNYPK